MTRFVSTWSSEEIALFDQHYAKRGGAWVAKALGCPASRVYQRAHRLGLKAERRGRGVCACGDHAWLILTRGACALLDPADLAVAGSGDWCLSGDYPASAAGGKTYLHRAIMAPPAGFVVDHLSGDTWDARRRNLRVCTQRQNMQNVRTAPRAVSGFRGVKRCGSERWLARIHHDGATQRLGVFATAEAAATAYDEAAIRLRGAHVRLNFSERIAA